MKATSMAGIEPLVGPLSFRSQEHDSISTFTHFASPSYITSPIIEKSFGLFIFGNDSSIIPQLFILLPLQERGPGFLQGLLLNVV